MCCVVLVGSPWILVGESLLSFLATGNWGSWRCDVFLVRARKFLLGFLSQSNLRQKQLRQVDHPKKRFKLFQGLMSQLPLPPSAGSVFVELTPIQMFGLSVWVQLLVRVDQDL